MALQRKTKRKAPPVQAGDTADRPRTENGVAGAISFFDTALSLEELAAQQGVSPVMDPDELLGDFWPEEESIDDFIASVRAWRRDEPPRES